MNINPNVLAFKPRQVQLLSSASPQIMPSDNHLLLHSIARYLEQSGLSKTLKKFRSEANINQDDLGTSSFDLEEMFRNFLETCGHANKKLESHQVQETLSNKKKKKDDCDVDVAEKSGQEQNVDSEILKKSPDKKCKNKKKSKSKLDSDPLADDIEPASKELPGLTVEKSQDDQTSEDNVVTDSQTKTKSKDKKKKKNRSSDHAVEDVHLKTDVMNASGEDMTNKQDRLSKKRKRLTSEEDSPELANEKEAEDSKCGKTGTSKKPKVNDGECCKIPTEKHNEQANGYIETNAEHSATLSNMKKQWNGSSETGIMLLQPKSVKHFQRIKVDEVVFSDERLKDNSYWAKEGADTGYGAKAQEVLGQVRGRGFRHEKTKKKRGTYRGGQIDLQSHSIKFNYSDDD